MKVELYKVIKITAGRFHCWVDSNVGRIKKPNSAISEALWNEFDGIKPAPAPALITKLKWYQKLWLWILKLLKFK
jgi:hypothetical protein